MSKVGIYYAYWTHDWDVDFHPFVDKVADLGFDILEVNGGTIGGMSTAERRALKQHAVDRGIDLSYCIGLTADRDPASPDAAVRQKGVAWLEQMIEGVGEMGGGLLSGILYGAWPVTMPRGESDKRPYLERSIESVRTAARSAGDAGVTLNMEVVNRFEQFLLNTAQEAVDYVQAVGSPNVKILLDTFHMNIEEESLEDAILTAGSLLGHVHLGECNRRPPGEGSNIRWDQFAAALRKIDYQGAMVMEPFLMPGGQVGADIHVFRDLSVGVDMDAAAAASVQFMRRALAAAA